LVAEIYTVPVIVCTFMKVQATYPMDLEDMVGRTLLITDMILEENIQGSRPRRLFGVGQSHGDHWMFAILAQ
jgi:hypothetical protein